MGSRCSGNSLDVILNEINENINWGFYLNCGSGNPEDKIIKTGISAAQYSEYVSGYLKFHPSIIGSCCGSTPEHTKVLRKLIDNHYAAI